MRDDDELELPDELERFEELEELDELLELDPPPPEDEDDDEELELGAVDDELDDDVLEVLGAGEVDDPVDEAEDVAAVDEPVGPVGLSLSQAIEPSPMVMAPPLRRRRKSRRSARLFRGALVSFWSAMPAERAIGGPAGDP